MTLSPAERRAQRWQRRSAVHRVGDRWARAAGTWDGNPFRRAAGCGRVCHDDMVSIRVRPGDDGSTAYPTGVATCGSVWLCAVCSAKIRARRSIEVTSIAQQHVAAGGTLHLLTLTVRHARDHSLQHLMDVQASAWRSLIQSVQWRELVRPSLAGLVRSWEVTHGFDRAGGGWHPHFHVLLLLEEGETIDTDWIAEAWRERVVRRDPTMSPNEHGVDVREVNDSAAQYVTKIGHEMTRADVKGGAQVWQLIDALEDGDTWARHRLTEYARATKGRRAVQFSRGLRARFGIDELTDEELADLEVGGVLVDTMHPNEWRRLNRYGGYRAVPEAVRYLERIEALHQSVRSVVT